MHNSRLVGKIGYIKDPHPLPTKPSLYTGNPDMMEEQRRRHCWGFMGCCANYMEHSFKDWTDVKGHHDSKNPFWINLWDPKLLRICEDIDLYVPICLFLSAT
jgi:hypothetical protein